MLIRSESQYATIQHFVDHLIAEHEEDPVNEELANLLEILAAEVMDYEDAKAEIELKAESRRLGLPIMKTQDDLKKVIEAKAQELLGLTSDEAYRQIDAGQLTGPAVILLEDLRLLLA